MTNNEDTPIISVRHVSKIYPVEDDEPVKALDDVSLDIYPGEICCIFGQSGSGKSTLLNQLAGLEKPEIGAIRIQNTILNRLNEEQLAVFRQKHIGFVFQSYNLLGHLNALENVEMPLIFQGVDPVKRKQLAENMLIKVGLEKRMLHYPRQMSGDSSKERVLPGRLSAILQLFLQMSQQVIWIQNLQNRLWRCF